jgi:argininosuccinate lyase
MKLWEKGYTVNDKIEKFTVGKDRELDLYIAKYDILGNIAQAKMLAKVGLLSETEKNQLLEGLHDLFQQVENGTFVIEKEFEDVHSKIEHYLTQKYGDAGKKIHTGRSRNDQILTDLQLFYKEYSKNLVAGLVTLINKLLEKAEKHKEDLIPGYTHFQAAMPSSFGLWFSAYAEQLILDLYLVEAAHKTADQNPLGSAAGFGSSFPIDREFTTQELGFNNLLISSVGAQMLRGKSEKALSFALAQISGTIGKMAYDLVLYNAQEFGFVKLPKEFTTGSSIMPHKTNPDVFELTRAHCNKIQSIPNTLMLATNNLPSGYHRDFQVLKEILFVPMMQMLNIIDINTFAIDNIEVIQQKINQPIYDVIYTVENINKQIQEGIPFRDAYKNVGLEVNQGTFIPNKNFNTTHTGSIHNLRLDKIKEKLDSFLHQSTIK